MKILQLTGSGSKGLSGKATIAEWTLSFRDMQQVARDCSAFEPRLAQKTCAVYCDTL